MNKYIGQALAIVLVLLLAGSIVGFAIYSRMIRESERVVDERYSTEANELTETIIGLMSTLEYDQVRNDEVLELLECDDESILSDGTCRKHNLEISELTEIINSMGIDEEIDFSEFEQEMIDSACLAELSISGLDKGFTIQQDEAHSIFLNRVNWGPADCQQVTFNMTPHGASGFIMSAFYGEYENGDLVSYKPYEFNDIVGFKYGAGGNNWQGYSSGEHLTFGLGADYPAEKSLDGKTYQLYEIRFKSLSDSSYLELNTSGKCNLGDNLLVEIGATCGNKYAGKSFVLPEASFAPSMFDYVYFQGKGGIE